VCAFINEIASDPTDPQRSTKNRKMLYLLWPTTDFHNQGDEMKIIGLGHYSRTGKDSFANFLVQELSPHLRVKKLPFAWKLKQISFELYAWDGMREPEFYETIEGAPYRDIKLPTIGKTPVEIWVALGTPAIREQVYDDTFINFVLLSDHDVDVLIIPDVRFPNETAAIHKFGGHLTKVVRPGYGPRNTVADRALIGYTGWDNVVGEVGTMESLHEHAKHYAFWLRDIEYYPPSRPPKEFEAALAVEKIEPWSTAA
jgi:hypothetical protein